MGFQKKVKGTQCYYACQKFDISKDARCIFRHIPEVCFFFQVWKDLLCFVKCQTGACKKRKRKKKTIKCWMYIIWRTLIYFVFSLLCKNTNSHSPSEQTTFAGWFWLLKLRIITAGQKHWACSLSNYIVETCGDKLICQMSVPICISCNKQKIMVWMHY